MNMPFSRPGQTICSFLHLPVASSDLFGALSERNITAIAYEMIKDNGQHPVLLPASQIAGRMAPLIAGQLLSSTQTITARPGLGILLSGLPGVPAATVTILGGGVLGSSAARAFLGLGAEVIVLDKDIQVLQRLSEQYEGRLTTMLAHEFSFKRVMQFTDVLVGAVLVSGQRAPILIKRDLVRKMRSGSVIIDFAIDDGGCVETSRPTTLRDPAYMAEGVIHYCVPNVTAAFARTTSYAITNAALPYLATIGKFGVLEATKKVAGLTAGINLYQGQLAHSLVLLPL